MTLGKLINWAENVAKKMKWYDISLTKLATAAFVLLIAKYWPVLTSFDTWIYVVIGVLAAISPVKKLFS